MKFRKTYTVFKNLVTKPERQFGKTLGSPSVCLPLSHILKLLSVASSQQREAIIIYFTICQLVQLRCILLPRAWGLP